MTVRHKKLAGRITWHGLTRLLITGLSEKWNGLRWHGRRNRSGIQQYNRQTHGMMSNAHGRAYAHMNNEAVWSPGHWTTEGRTKSGKLVGTTDEAALTRYLQGWNHGCGRVDIASVTRSRVVQWNGRWWYFSVVLSIGWLTSDTEISIRAKTRATNDMMRRAKGKNCEIQQI